MTRECNHNWTNTALTVFHPQPDNPMPVATSCEDMQDPAGNGGFRMQMCVGCGLLRLDPNDKRTRCLVFPHPEHEDPTAEPDINTR